MSTPRPPECKCGHTEDQHSIVRDRYCMMSGCVCECFEGVAAPLEPSAHDLAHRIWAIGYIGPVPEPTAADEAEIKLIAKMVSDWAAAVSKNLQEERDRLLLAKDCDKCGEEITPTGYRLCGKCTSELEKKITGLRTAQSAVTGTESHWRGRDATLRETE